MSKAENNTYRVKTDGFHGELFLPVEDKAALKRLVGKSDLLKNPIPQRGRK